MMSPFLLKSFVFATTAATLINVFYVNLIKKDGKTLFSQKNVNNETIFDSLKSNNPTKISEPLEKKIPTFKNTLNTISQQEDLNSKESDKEEIKEKLRTEIQTSIFSLQKNLLNLIIQKQTSNQEIIDKQKFFNTNEIFDNENNQLEKEEEILKSLKNNIKTLYESKKNLRKKNSEYLENVYNFFFSFSVNQKWEEFFSIGKVPDPILTKVYQKINLTKKTFSSADETETIFGILFKDSQNTNSKILLDIGSENLDAKEWNDFSQLKPNDFKINDFNFTKEEFKLLNSHWGTPLCEISGKRSLVLLAMNTDKNFLYSCSEKSAIDTKKSLDIVIGDFENNITIAKFQEWKETINQSWDNLKKEKNKFADEVKKIQTAQLTYKLTQKEILEFLPFENTQEIKNKNTENLIKKLSEKWSKESFLKVINF